MSSDSEKNSTDFSMESGRDKVLSGISLSIRFFEIAIEEFESGDRERQKDACEKGYRAATEALDVILKSRGVRIDVGQPEAHIQRKEALIYWETIDPFFKRINIKYSLFKDELHGLGFYSNADPKQFKNRLLEVKTFINLINDNLE